MTYRSWGSFLFVCFAAFLTLELWSYFNNDPTLSQSVWAATDSFEPLKDICLFAFGLLCGHFWWPRRVGVFVPVFKCAEHSDTPQGGAVFDAKSLKEFEGVAYKRAFPQL